MDPSVASFLLACDHKGLKYPSPRVGSGGETLVSLGVRDPHGFHYTVMFIFYPEGQSAAVRVYRFASVPAHMRSYAVRRCNTLNNRHSWVKFVLDEDGDVNMEADCIITPESAGDICMEIFRRFTETAHAAYPLFHAEVWGEGGFSHTLYADSIDS